MIASVRGGVVYLWLKFDKLGAVFFIIDRDLHNCSDQMAIDRFFSFDLVRTVAFNTQIPDASCPMPDRKSRRYNRYLCRCVFTFTSSRSAPNAAAAVRPSIRLSNHLSAAQLAAVLARLSFVANSHAPHSKVGQTGLNPVFGTRLCRNRARFRFRFFFNCFFLCCSFLAAASTGSAKLALER